MVLPSNPTPEQIREYVAKDAVERYSQMSAVTRDELERGLAMVEGQTARVLGPEVWNR